MTMRALTLWRPWSDAIVRGPKRVENRPWMPPSSIIGTYIAIHAGKTYDFEATVRWQAKWRGNRYEHARVADSPMGVVGIARVLGALDMRNGRRTSELALLAPDDASEVARKLWTLDADPWWSGPCGWLLDDVIALELPVRCPGARSPWSLPHPVERAVRKQWEARR